MWDTHMLSPATSAGRTTGLLLALLIMLWRPPGLNAASVSHDVSTGSNDVDCILDDDGSNAALDACLLKGETFHHRYLKKLAKGRTKYDVCEDFVEFNACIQPMLDKCDSIRHKLRHHQWLTVVEQLSCACNETADCRESFNCFEREFTDILAQRCDAMYKFNKKQRTHGRCHFLQEKISCKEALVTSSCGDDAGQLAFSLMKLEHMDRLRRTGCHIHRDQGYTGFRYTESCAKDFLQKMTVCAQDHLFQTEVTFLRDNDLVTDAKKKDLKKACKNLREYKLCMKPLEDLCPAGPNQVYNYDGHLRTFLMKMEYICEDVKKDYLSNLPCYKEVLDNRTLSQCNAIWTEMKPLLSDLTSHTFFCDDETENVTRLKQDLERFRRCYIQIFTTSCGQRAGEVMGELIERAFEDPLYLRLEYKPDCRLHAPLSTTTTTTTTATTTTVTTTPKTTTSASLSSKLPREKQILDAPYKREDSGVNASLARSTTNDNSKRSEPRDQEDKWKYGAQNNSYIPSVSLVLLLYSLFSALTIVTSHYQHVT